VHERIFRSEKGYWHVMSPDGQKTWYKLALPKSNLEYYEWDWLQNNEPKEKPTVIGEEEIVHWRKIWNK